MKSDETMKLLSDEINDVVGYLIKKYPNLSNKSLICRIVEMIKSDKLYDPTKLYEKDSNIIYHFTSFENLTKILFTKKLLLNSFEKSNDPKEFQIKNLLFSGDVLKDGFVYQHIVSKYKQCCFCTNYKIEDKCISGIDHPMMWAQYADKHRGGCIVLNRNNLISNNKLDKSYFSSVEYVDVINDIKGNENYKKNYQTINDNNIDKFINEYKHLIFFEKYTNWEQEHEIKLVSKDKDSISIDGCIEYVCLGLHVEDDVKRSMKDIFTDIEFLKAEFGNGHCDSFTF